MSGDIGDIRHPRLVWRTHVELLLQPVRRHHGRVSTLRSKPPPIADLRFKPGLPHQASHSVFTARLPLCTQVIVHLAIAVYTTAFQPMLLYQSDQTPVVTRV